MNGQGQGAYRSQDACVRCGAHIDTTSAAFTGDGMVCRACESAESVREASTQASTSSFGPMGWGLLSLVCNPFFVPSIMAIAGGVKELQLTKAVGRDELGNAYGDRRNKAVAGIVLGAVHPVFMVAIIFLAVVGGLVGAMTGAFDDPYDPYGSGYDSYGSGYDSYGSTYDSYGSTYDSYDSLGADPYGSDQAAMDQQAIDDLLRTMQELEQLEQQNAR